MELDIAHVLPNGTSKSWKGTQALSSYLGKWGTDTKVRQCELHFPTFVIYDYYFRVLLKLYLCHSPVLVVTKSVAKRTVLQY